MMAEMLASAMSEASTSRAGMSTVAGDAGIAWVRREAMCADRAGGQRLQFRMAHAAVVGIVVAGSRAKPASQQSKETRRCH